MVEPGGRRAANHAATHQAITRAAGRLFTQQGFEATSVRQIAEAAGVGERTFYRYFDGKDALLAGEIDAWLAGVAEAILAQPAGTSVLTVVRDAVRGPRESDAARPAIEWLLASVPRPLESLRRSGLRPVRRFERTVQDALIARDAALGLGEPATHHDLTARVCVAVVRSVVARARTDAPDGRADASFHVLLDAGFDELAQLLGEAAQPPAARASIPETA